MNWYGILCLVMMKPRLSALQSQKTILAPLMQQSIEILMLPHLDLSAAIEQELQNNPLLEAASNEELKSNERENPAHLGGMHHTGNHRGAETEQLMDEDDDSSPQFEAKQTLHDHLISQLHLEINDSSKRLIGELIIGNLDDDGYLTLTTQDIAKEANINNVALIEQVLEQIHQFDPIGIAARDVKECLTIQAKIRCPKDADIVVHIITEFLDELGQKKYDFIAKKIHKSIDEVQAYAQFIASLDPKPASNYQTTDPNIYIQPDLYLVKDPLSTEFKLFINRRGSPVLRLNQTYSAMLTKKNITESERQFIKDKMTHAVNFIKSVQQRGETLLKTAEYILAQQKGFFEGNAKSLVPLSLKDIAAHLNRNESTISRAISNKYIDTPIGLFPLKFFFSQAVASSSESDVSTHSIKEEIQNLIEDEDKNLPLSDQAIVDYFKAKGMTLARRTISKYRQELNIPSSHKR